ncbi:zinc-dependent alcohol dehydrogenase [Microbacterium sp. gxy059]|uniref:zinc-dependent alcohol dehydrogenase n=1 Tax=Microbacterium sp. gxy059 TaxID=2957199 RepID=UPI003D966FC4
MTDETMRRITVTAPGVIEVVEAERPVLRDGEVRARMTVSGVCGSDVHASHGRHPFVPLPYNPGHEVVGVVTEVAAGAEGVAVGDRVTVEPTLPCGSCKMCRTERSNLCENLRFFGCGYEQGGMADEFTVPATRIHVLPDDLDDLQASLIEPLATPVHAVRLAGDVAGRAVVVIGAGTIGLLVMKAARHAGARTIVMTDMLESKRERALRLGADAVVDAARPDVADAVRAELGESADVVFDCVAVQPTVEQAVAMALKGGTVAIVGVPAADVTVPLPLIQDQQVRIQGSATYLAEDYATAIEIIRAGSVTPADFVTARFPLDRAAEAFAAASGGEQVKVLVTA